MDNVQEHNICIILRFVWHSRVSIISTTKAATAVKSVRQRQANIICVFPHTHHLVHVRQSDVSMLWPHEANFECRFESGLIKTRICLPCVSWLEFGRSNFSEIKHILENSFHQIYLLILDYKKKSYLKGNPELWLTKKTEFRRTNKKLD
jgi:hypothetical protein